MSLLDTNAVYSGMFTEDVKSSLVIDFQRFHITVP